MKRKVGYTWRLCERWPARIYTATELVPLLRERPRLASEVHRLVSPAAAAVAAGLSALWGLPAPRPTWWPPPPKARRAQDRRRRPPAPPSGAAKLRPGRLASCPRREPSPCDRRAVRTLVPGRVLPLRAPPAQGGQLAEQVRLPHLRRPRVRCRGVCPGCGRGRALPGGRPGDDIAICATCAGFSQSFACSRCGLEDKLHGGVCAPAALRLPPDPAARRRHRPDPSRACAAGRLLARHGPPAVRADLAIAPARDNPAHPRTCCDGSAGAR